MGFGPFVCRGCGELLPAIEFNSAGRGSRKSSCRLCANLTLRNVVAPECLRPWRPGLDVDGIEVDRLTYYRFVRRVSFAADGCWPWGGRLCGGYGQFSLDRHRKGAHRVAYQIWHGPMPRELTIDHLCRNRSCVRPSHLEAVPHHVNVLRGEGIPARNAAKTHCINGHDFAPENTMPRRGGGRRCRACHNTRSLAGYHRRKAARS